MGKGDGAPMDWSTTRAQLIQKGISLEENMRMLVLYLLVNPGDSYARCIHERWGMCIDIQGVSVLKYNADEMYELKRGGFLVCCGALRFVLLLVCLSMFETDLQKGHRNGRFRI